MTSFYYYSGDNLIIIIAWLILELLFYLSEIVVIHKVNLVMYTVADAEEYYL